jgi:hypothetical protein
MRESCKSRGWDDDALSPHRRYGFKTHTDAGKCTPAVAMEARARGCSLMWFRSWKQCDVMSAKAAHIRSDLGASPVLDVVFSAIRQLINVSNISHSFSMVNPYLYQLRRPYS